MPRVSVLMPVYNVNKQYLCESIESILNQTFTDYEFIIIDDGSKESIEDIVNSYDDSRIRFYRNEKNLGVAKTRNRLLDVATGEYLANQDADDISLPERLQTMVDFLDNNPNVGVCGCNIKMIPENYKLNYPEHVSFLNMLYGCCMLNPTLMFRKQIIEKYFLRYDETFVSAEDYNILSKMIKVCDLYNIQKVLLHYRNTEGSLSKNPVTHLYDTKTKNEMINFLTKDPILQKKIWKLVDKHYNKKTFLKWLFSITNCYAGIKKYKCFQICGIKIKTSCNSLYSIDNCLIDLFKNRGTDNDALMIEVNDFHGETFPGNIKYLLDLGYKVNLLTTEKHKADLDLCKFRSEKLETFYTNISTIDKILSDTKILNKYKLIFVNSLHVFRADLRNKKNPTINKYFHNIYNTKTTYINVCHDLQKLPYIFAKKHNCITLAETKAKLPIVNPCYFGDISITPKNDKTIFLVSGDLRRDYSIIESAVQQLIEHNITDFEVYITGRKNYTVKSNLTKYINFAGYLDFEQLYSLVEKADFILPCLEPNKKKHEKYLYYTTSGCFQLSYGFCKPMVIAKKFAQKALVDNNSALLYDQNEDMYKAMTNAINMPKDEYNSMQNNIKKITKALYEQSKENLKKIITKESPNLCLK